MLQESELLSLVRSLLMAWSDPLALLSSEATSLPHPERNSINTKTRELQDHTNSLGAGLERLGRKVHVALRVQRVFKISFTDPFNIEVKVNAVYSA